MATRGSIIPYKISARILMRIKKVADTSTDPITTGKSSFSNASTVTRPIPFHPKIYSTKKAPASNSANQPVMAVTTGFNALRKACFQITDLSLNPLVVLNFLMQDVFHRLFRQYQTNCRLYEDRSTNLKQSRIHMLL